MKKISLDLLDCETDLILKSLQLYAHTSHYFYPKRKAVSEEQSSELDMIKDTYHQVLEQFSNQMNEEKEQIEENQCRNKIVNFK